MHRHGYVGRKFGRETDQRKALIKGLVTSLIEKGSIETTVIRAKEIRPVAEALITKAIAGGLHNRRQIIAALSTLTAAHKLVDDIAPKLNGRQGGYLRIKPTRVRIGDNTQMARISFVDDLSVKTPAAKPEAKPAVKKAEVKKAPAKKPVAKKAEAK
jgi:large subunit ribosomal protein L17